MRTRGMISRSGRLLAAASLLLVALPATAGAEEAEAPVISFAWYWEDAQTEEFTTPNGEKVTIETPNPFCPGAGSGTGNPAQTCAEGRLPIEIRSADYEEPNKLSAVTFDLSLVPVGSTVTKFIVKFLEAKSGCFEDKSNPNVQQTCEETSPSANIDEQELQACVVDEIFGEGEAREYKERPKYTCTDADPVAKRKETSKIEGYDGNKDNAEHIWTFDLTTLAQGWVSEFTVNTAVMLVGKEPKEPGPENNSWRVVLAGPEAKDGITTNIEYEPPKDTIDDDFGDDTTTDPGGGGGTPTGPSTVVGPSGGGPSFGGGGPAPPAGGGGQPVDTGGGQAAGDQASDEGPEPVVSWPWYMWFVLLAGIVGFSLVRSAVIESSTGARADGVLAQIRRLNADRRGTAVVEEIEGGPLGALAAATGAVTSKLSQVLGKLRFSRKG